MKYNIIGGISQQYYHTIPQDIDMIKISPTREGIFKYLAQIGYERFPEFIADILVKVEGHNLIDITDGPGDEKRDVFTEKDGERFLIQCKHTINYKANSNGDDLDLLFSACIRKDCIKGLYVTNADLTPQGKRYVHDNEYSRGWKGDAKNCPSIDYWNGNKIWEKISTNSDILNKWFSGLGQVDGIRNFKFDLTFQKMPYSANAESKDFNEIVKLLSEKDWAIEVEKELIYQAGINSDYQVIIKKWFQFPESLGLNFIPPTESMNFANRPFYSFSVEVQVGSNVTKYSVDTIRDTITKFFGNELLPAIEEGSWWHIISSQPKSFIYLHDIGEPREIELAGANTYVKTNDSSCYEELEYCLPDDANLIRSTPDEEQADDLIWIDQKSQTQIILMFDQKMHPVEVFNHQVQQYYKMEGLKSHTFKAISDIDNKMMMRVRKLLHPEWVALQSENQELFWAYPPDQNQELITKHENKIKSLGLKILEVRAEDVEKILSQVVNDIHPGVWFTNSTLSSISVPALLTQRTFWLSKELEIKKSFTEEMVADLIKFKFTYEHEHGFDNLQGDENITLRSGEIKETLFDLFTFRGKRMLDIAIFNNPISINIRFREGKIQSANELSEYYLKEFEKAYQEIRELLKDFT